MTMQKKTLVILSACCALFAAGVILTAGPRANALKGVIGGDATSYTLALDSSTVITHGTYKYVTTTNGNIIDFNFDDFVKGTDTFGSLAAGKYFGNSKAIDSITSVTANVASGSLRVYYGFSYTYSGGMYDSGVNLTSSVTSVDLSTTKPHFLRFVAEEAAVITSMNINYSCPFVSTDSYAETVGSDGYENLNVDKGYSTPALIKRYAVDGNNVGDSSSKRSMKLSFAPQASKSYPHIGFDLGEIGYPAMAQGKLHARIKISASMHTWASAILVDSTWTKTAEKGMDFGTADANGWYDWSIDVSQFANTNKIYRLMMNFYNKSTDSSEQYVYIDLLGFDTGYETMSQDTGWQVSTPTLEYGHATTVGTSYKDLRISYKADGNEKFVLNPAADNLTSTFATAKKMEFDIKSSLHPSDLTGDLTRVRVIDNGWKSSTTSAPTLTAGANGWYHAVWSDFGVAGDTGYAESSGIIRICFMLDSSLITSGGAYVLLDNITFGF